MRWLLKDQFRSDLLIGKVTAPVLVLHGDQDVMVPTANAEIIAAQLPDAAVHLTAGGRHGFFEEFASSVTPRVVAFLRS